MKLTIIVPDGMVGVDGDFRQVSLAGIADNIHAVQLNGNIGHVEFNDGSPNELIDSTAPFQTYIDRWDALTPAAKTLLQVRAEKVELIKSHRDYLTVNGGHKIGNYWYHSNEISLIQQLALNGLANQMAASGATDATAIIATPWKTLGGEYVTLTVGIAKNFVMSALTQQSALFSAAQNKMNEVNALTTIEAVNAYDINAGFPEVYQPA